MNQKKYMEIIKEFVELFEKDKNVIGITLNGGIARGTGDEYSEIDLHFYVKNKKIFPYKFKGDCYINGVWFDAWTTTLKSEYEEKAWEMGKKWDRSHCKILFDRQGEVRKLFKEKLRKNKKNWNKLVRHTLFEAGWCLQLAETFMHRKKLRHAHILLNLCLDKFVDYYFLKKNEFIPAFKWKYYFFERLAISKKVKECVFRNYLIKNYSVPELEKRIEDVKMVIVKEDLKEDYFAPPKQDSKVVARFEDSLKKEMKIEKPWSYDVGVQS